MIGVQQKLTNVVVAAFPQDAAKIIIIDSEKQEKQEDVMCWGYEIIPTLMDIVEKYPEVGKITFLGPQDYITPFAANAENEFPGISVEIGQM